MCRLATIYDMVIHSPWNKSLSPLEARLPGNEGMVFHACAEPVLDLSDRVGISDKDGLQDPLAEMESLADDYPGLAAQFDLATVHLAASEAPPITPAQSPTACWP